MLPACVACLCCLVVLPGCVARFCCLVVLPGVVASSCCLVVLPQLLVLARGIFEAHIHTNTYTGVQARGIFEAALAAKGKGWLAVPNIMVPLVGCVKEFESQVMCC